MQVTIDSAEPLEQVLPVIEALYGVDLSVSPRLPAPRRPDSRTGSRSSRASKAAVARKGAGPVAKRSRRAKPNPDSADVRNWARTNGHEVKDRGRVPAALVAAYLAQI